MKPFFWRITFCTVPVLLAALVVGLAFKNYWDGKGGFKLGVDLVGGTILIYEVDVNKFPEGKLPQDWNPQELAKRLKSRIDPSDLYNITIRAVSNTRFEIILPTGGAHQINAEQAEWDGLLRSVEEKFPYRHYRVIPGRATELIAIVNGQHPEVPVKEVQAFIEANYKLRDGKPDPAAWDSLLKKLDENEKLKPTHYVVGRGRDTELIAEVTQQHKEASVKDVQALLQQDGSGKGGRRTASLTQEQVQEAKELIGQVGSLEFRILASYGHDDEALKAATEYYERVAKEPALQADLDRLALLGKPPTPPTQPDGTATFTCRGPDGMFTYSWVELGPFYRAEPTSPNAPGLSNPRDEKNTLYDPDKVPDETKFSLWKQAAQARAKGKPMPFGNGLLYSREVKNPRLPEKDREKRYEYFLLTRDPEEPSKKVTGDYLAAAGPGDDGRSVSFRMKPAGADLFYEFTTKNKGQLMAIVLDGFIESAATIQNGIRFNGQITGNFDADKINQLVRVLRSGALPATLKTDPVSESTMGPTLGADTIKWGATSVVLAFAAVLLFMLFYYRFAGLVACVALLANLLMTVAFMVLINATFTLPGLAGLVLMLGMAVDANVLIYERLREERERGASLALAIRNGYEHALPTIIDTHLSSIFTAVVLYVVGNDQLKGFGISLTVGLIISLFTSLYMTRLLFDLWQSRGWLQKLSMLRLFHKPNIDFMRIRYYWFAATVILTVLGATLFVYRMPDPENPNKKSILNIDFVGGTAYGGELTRKVDLEQLRPVLERTGLPDLSVEQIFISSPEYTEGSKSKLFTLRTSEKDLKVVQDAINQVLAQNPASEIQLKRINLHEFRIQSGNREVTLAFTDPDSGQPAFASRAQVSTLLGRKLTEAGLDAAAQSLSLEGLGREEEGHFQWMKVVFLDPVKEPEKLGGALKATQKEFAERPQPERLEVFDSQLAAETQLIALYAILASWAAILLYLWFRFGSWTFGAATVICLIHDLFFTLGVIAACHYVSDLGFFHNVLGLRDFKIDLPTVAALLTLVGYSVNDTIVVFDRIREVRGKNPALTPQMINDSVNQTLSRTVLASLTVWVVVIVLYIWGGEGVHLFAFVMIVGVVVGTYSSIYIASPLLLIFGEGKTSTQPARQLQPAGQR